jgi:hypothetical protein
MTMSGLDLFGDRSTIDTGVRSEGDFYETPAWQTRSLLAHHPIPRGSRVLECAAGRGAITRVLEDAGCVVTENDIDPLHRREFQYDMTRPESWLALVRLRGPFDFVITNLPFNIAILIIRLGLNVPRSAFISVLLKSFDEPTYEERPGIYPRADWLTAHPWTRKINQPRHSYRGTGSPSMASDWFIWERDRDASLPPCVVDAIAKTRTRSCHEE